MVAWITKKLEQLLDTLVDPLWERIKVLHWASRLIILVLCAATLLISLNWKEAERYIGISRRIIFSVLSFNYNRIPLSNDQLLDVKRSISTLHKSLEADIFGQRQPFNDEIEIWSNSQLVVSMNDILYGRRDAISGYFISNMDPSCACWREFANAKNVPRHMLVTGWVIYALAHLDYKVPSETIKFVLEQQTEAGAWSMFLYSEREQRQENSSTYATAQIILALNELMARKLLASDQVNQVHSSIKRGNSWLMSHKVPDQARWFDYPLSRSKTVSLALSGLAIYTINKIDQSGFVEDKWVEELPKTPPQASYCEMYIKYSLTLDGQYQDHNCQVSLAWTLAATVDAYPKGNLYHKVKTIYWIDRVLSETNILNSVTLEKWKRSEILISLRHLAKNAQ